MVKHNNQLPNVHLNKDWQKRVKTWFDQPGRKKRRRSNRLKKASAIAPRPIDLLRPAVRCPTIKYNTRMRLGRGFTMEEIKAAGVRRKEALTLGISIDYRRRNKSMETFELNVQRLKNYKAKLIIFPKKKAPKNKMKVTPEDEQAYKQVSLAQVFPLPAKPSVEEGPRMVTDQDTQFNAYETLRKARSHQRYKGKREAKAKEEAAKK